MRTTGIPPATTTDSAGLTAPAPETHLRELDHRAGDGIDVRLLWDSRTNHVSVAVTDEHTGAILTFVVDGAEATIAFHHPYAYALHALA
ncbi:MAG: hypothetical protein ACXVRN_06935 [Solirubrobacteraceae bacterium]